MNNESTGIEEANDSGSVNQNDGETATVPENANAVAAKTTNFGELLGPPYASPLPPFTFWIETLCISVQSAALSLFALGYLNAVFEFQKLWTTAQGNDGYPDDPSTTGFLDGRPFWIAVGAGTGLVVGVLKAYILRFDEYPGFIEDLSELDASPILAVKVTIVCLISLMGGASLGPESGLGAACGGFAVVFSKYVNELCAALSRVTRRSFGQGVNEEQAKQEQVTRRKLLVLAGFVAAFSTILPSPASALLLCVELAKFDELAARHGLPYVKTICQLVFAGTVSFLVFTALEDGTWLNPRKALPGFVYTYKDSDIGLALLYGVMGSVLGLAYIVIGGIVKRSVAATKVKLEDVVGRKMRIVILAVAGGAIFGLLNYIFPLTVGDGSDQIGTVILRGGTIGSNVLAASTFVKMFQFWICNETGFVGGLFLPLLITSTMFGRMIVNETDAGLIMSMACSLVAMASSFAPIPLALLLLSLSTFNLSATGSIPVFVCVVTSHMLFAGMGIPQVLLARAKPKEENETEGALDNVAPSS